MYIRSVKHQLSGANERNCGREEEEERDRVKQNNEL